MKPCGQDILAREGAGRKPYSAGLCREYATGCTCLAFSLQLRCRRRACRPAGIQIELTHLVEEGFVANAQHAGRILAAPMRLLQSVGDGFHLCFILQAAHQRLETLLARGRRFFAGRGSLTCGGHLQQLAEAAFIVLKNDVALDEIFQLPQVAGPGVAPSGLQQMVRRLRGRLLEFFAIFGEEVAEQQGDLRHAFAQRRRSEEHTSELQSLAYLVCRLLLEKKKKELIYMCTVDNRDYLLTR